MPDQKKFYVLPEQLRIGMFVILEVSWFSHNFARNRFIIKSNQQIDAIRQMGLKQIRIDPSQSKLNPPPENAASTASTIRKEVAEKSSAEKKLQIELINRQRAAVAECERRFVKATNVLKKINTKVFSQPEQAQREAEGLIEEMTASMLTDRDVTVNLMSDRIGGEDLYIHSLNVTVLAMMLARELGMTAQDIKHLGMGCLLHDLGKLEVPRWIISKTTPLTEGENALLQMHSQYGVPIARKVGLSNEAIDIVLQHHENMDGSGYPGRLKADQISPLARIAAIVNVFDNYCNPSDPSHSMSPSTALAYMFAKESNKFDHNFLSVFIRCMGVYPPGTVVRLSDGSYAMVISVNFNKPLHPTVLIYDSAVPKDEAIFLDLQNEHELKVEEAVAPMQLPSDAFKYLNPKKRTTYYFDVPKQQLSP